MKLNFATKRHYRLLVVELGAVALLAIISFFAGTSLLESWNPPIDSSLPQSMYMPSLAFAADKGFHDLDTVSHPELASFFSGETRKLDPSSLPDMAETRPLNYHQQNHLYLIAFQGALWKIFGVSWDVTKYLLLFLLVLSILLVYGICRMGMGPILGVVAACLFLYTSSLAEALPILRDFCKAPFFLGCLFFCGLLIRGRGSFVWTASLVAGMGLIAGLGLGFRRDMLVLLPLCAPVVLFIPNKAIGPKRRVFLLGLLSLCAVVGGAGMISNLKRESSEDMLRMICGFASPLYTPLRIQAGSYELLPSFNDIHAMYAAEDMMRPESTPLRGEGLDTGTANADPHSARARQEYRWWHGMGASWGCPRSAHARQAYLLKLIRLFPADILTRLYGAVLSLLRGLDPLRFPFAGIPYGLLAAAGVLLGIAAYRPWTATLVLYLLLAFCGYTSLQFIPRHAFHLGFVPYFFIGTALHALTVSLKGRCLRHCLAKDRDHPRDARTSGVRLGIFDPSALLLGTRNLILWGFVVCGVLMTPLALLRHIQQAQLTALIRDYRGMELVPAMKERRSWGDRILFVPQITGDLRAQRTFVRSGIKAEGTTYALELQGDGGIPDIRLEYAADFPDSPFLRPRIPSHAAEGGALLYARVYEGLSREFPCHFLGFSVPQAEARRITGLYQIRHFERGLFPMILVIPKQSNDLYFHASLRPLGKPASVIREDYRRFAAFRDLDTSSLEAVERLLSEYENHPDLLLALAGIHASRGAMDAAVSYCLRYVDLYGTFSAITRLEKALRAHAGDSALELLFLLAEQRPDNDCLDAVRAMAANESIAHEIHAGWSLFLKGDFSAAQTLFEHALDLNPESPDAHLGASVTRMATGEIEYALAHFRPRYQNTILISAMKPNGFLNMAKVLVSTAIRRAEFQPGSGAYYTNIASNQSDRAAIPSATENTDSKEAVNVRLARFRAALDVPESAYSLLDALIQSGNSEVLVNTWMEIAEETPCRPLIHYCLGMAILHALSVDYPSFNDEILSALLDITPESQPEMWDGYIQYLSRLPGVARLGMYHGRKLLEMNKMERAISLLDRSIALDAELALSAASALQEAGDRLLENGAAQDAIMLYRKALNHERRNPLVWRKLGTALAAVRNMEEAEHAWRQSILTAPDAFAGYEAAKEINRQLPLPERMEVWQELKEQLPHAQLPLLFLALAYFETGQHNEALALLENIPSIDESSGEARIIRGLALCRAGLFEQGLDLLEGLPDADIHDVPEWADRVADVAKEESLAGNFVAAEQLFQIAIRSQPTQLQYKADLVEALMGSGKHLKAADLCLEILLQAPESPRTARNMDACYTQLNLPDEHRRAWQRVREAHPTAEIPRIHAEGLVP